MRRRELFKDLLRPTKPVSADVYRELTMFFYGLCIFLFVLLLAFGVDLLVVLGVVLVPLVLALMTMARRFTAFGWSPWWMLVAWPISAIFWIPLMASEAEDEADSHASGLLSRWKIDPSSVTPRSLIRRQVIVALIYGALIIVVAVVATFFSR